MDGRTPGEVMRTWQLLPKQAAFVEAFLDNGGDHIAAYQTAYGDVSRKVAATQGRTLLKTPKIVEILEAVADRARQELVVKHGLSEARIKEALMEIGFSRSQRPVDRIRALELLGKTCGLFAERNEVMLRGAVNVQVVTGVPDADCPLALPAP